MTKSEKINYDFLFRYIIVGDMGKKKLFYNKTIKK